jgi:hypothetical protein
MAGAVSGLIGSSRSSLYTTGGTTYNPGGNYAGVYFTSSGTFTIINGVRNIEVLVVAGGGGGGGGAYNFSYGYFAGGGGGAAALANNTTITNAPLGNYTITVGGGGAGGARAFGGGFGSPVQANQGGTGNTSSILTPAAVTISRTGPVGGGGALVYYPYYFFGGTGSGNDTYSGTNGYEGSSANAGGGGAGAGSNASGIVTYYVGALGGNTATVMDVTFGKGGDGGNWNSRNGTSGFQGSGGAGGSGANDASFGPGFVGTGGIIYLRWLK